IMNELDFEFQKRMERKEGREEGLEEGLAKGREEGIVATAKRMLGKGMPADLVAEISELPIETVRTL
ncbi:MAG: hypothetical protein ACI3ZL_05005, partial [Candidatus Cryptobacteroides sp.]